MLFRTHDTDIFQSSYFLQQERNQSAGLQFLIVLQQRGQWDSKERALCERPKSQSCLPSYKHLARTEYGAKSQCVRRVTAFAILLLTHIFEGYL